MSRNALISASVLLLAASVANAYEVKSGVSVQVPGASVQTNAEASAQLPSLQATKDAAVKAGQTSRDAALSAGVGALTTGKSALDSGKAAGQAAYGSAKDAAVAQGTAAKDAALEKAGLAKNIATGYKQRTDDAISAKDRVAVAKFASTQKATGAAVGKLTSLLGGANAQANGGLAKGYEKKLVIGGKLDADLGAQAKTIDSASVPGLSAQPKGTQLLLIGNQVVRVDAKTKVVLDVGAATL